MQVVNNIVLRKSERKEYFSQFMQSSNWILCMLVLVKENINTWDAYYLSYPCFPTTHCYKHFPKPKFTLPFKA